MTRLRAYGILRILTLAFWALAFTMTHIPSSSVPDVNLGDKSAHFITYGTLSGLLFATLWVRNPRSWNAVWVVPLALMAYGAVDEWLQIPVGRSCELADWVADTLGAVAVAGAMAAVRGVWALGRNSAAGGAPARP